MPPQSRYRGVENQLYRIDIHRGGTSDMACFEWSRESGSLALPVVSIRGREVALGAWWRDARLGLASGDWVEVLDDDTTLHQEGHPLCRVQISTGTG